MADPIRGPMPDEEIGADDMALLRTARDRYEKASDSDRENREKAVRDLEFLAGGEGQWPDDIRSERREDGRPMITINRLPQFLRQVTGDIRRNKPSIKVRPVDSAADEETADILTGLIRHIENKSMATVAYQTAADGSCGGGLGHFRVVTEYSDDDTFEQDIGIERITNHFAVTWDPQCNKITKEDARFCFVEEAMDVETFRARFPKSAIVEFDFDRQDWGWVGDWISNETVRVAEYWTIEHEERTLALMRSGETHDITDLEQTDGIWLDEDGLPLDVQRIRRVEMPKVQMRRINGAEVLDGPHEWPGRYIPIIPVLGEEIFVGRRVVRHGVIRHAVDPQRLYNYSRTAQTEMIALAPKAPYLVTPDNIKGVEDMWREANTRNFPYLIYTPDEENAGQPPKREAPPAMSSGLINEIAMAAEDMKGTTGIYDAGLGNRSNETSGVAIAERKEESDTGTYVFIDNLTWAMTHAGMILVDLIPKIYDTERVVRILNPDDTTESVVLNGETREGIKTAVKDITVGKYDVIVHPGPSFSTRRQEAAASQTELLRAVPGVAEIAMDLIVKNMDWPGADELAERFRRALPPGLVDPPEDEEPNPQMMARQAEMQKAQQIQLADLASKIAERRAKSIKAGAETKGVELENMQKQLEIAAQTGQLEQMIANAVTQALVQVTTQQPQQQPQQQIPMEAAE